MTARLAGSFVLLVVLGSAPRAQLGYLWSFDELAVKAQAIVIAE
jgi:hypothetical protein